MTTSTLLTHIAYWLEDNMLGEAGVDIFIGTLRTRGGVPDRALFILADGAVEEDRMLGSSDRGRMRMGFQVLVRDSAVDTGTEWSDEIYHALREAIIPPFHGIWMAQSAPLPLGRDPDDTYTWSINFEASVERSEMDVSDFFINGGDAFTTVGATIVGNP